MGWQKSILVPTILEKQNSLTLSLVLAITKTLKQWTRLFMTNNEKKKNGNSREGVTSYLNNKKIHKHLEGKPGKESHMSHQLRSEFENIQ